MHDNVFIITLVLVAVIAAVFIGVLRGASTPAAAGSSANPYRYRTTLFWVLIILGAGVSYATLAPWPHAPAPSARSSEPVTVTATGSQWGWELSRTQLPVGKPVVFAVTSTDVNHGFGIYDENMTMLTQVQAMPGYVNKVYYTFTQPGQYKVLCLEYCGVAHHVMLADLTVGAE